MPYNFNLELKKLINYNFPEIKTMLKIRTLKIIFDDEIYRFFLIGNIDFWIYCNIVSDYKIIYSSDKRVLKILKDMEEAKEYSYINVGNGIADKKLWGL